MGKNTKVKTKLIQGFGILVICLLVISIISILGMRTANNNLQEIIGTLNVADNAIKNNRIQVNTGARLVREMTIVTDKSTYPRYEADVNTAVQEIKNNLETLEKLYPLDDGLVEAYSQSLNDWIAMSGVIINKIKADDIAGAQSGILNDCAPALDGLIERSKVLTESIGAIVSQTTDTSYKNTQSSTYITLGLTLFAVIAGVGIAVSITKSIVAPLRELKTAALNMSQGDLKTKITYQSENEFGELAKGLSESMATLSAYIADIDRAMGLMASGDFNIKPSQEFIGDFKNIESSISKLIVEMSNTLDEVRQSADQLASASDQVASGAQMLAQGSTEQASASQELSATIIEISSSIKETSQNVHEADLQVKDAADALTACNEEMKTLNNAMNDISDKSKEIGKIIKTIEDIAFQTNILALNAAVEAARAGSAGKGFAVVADEVRNLASKSAEAAKSTTDLINGSLHAVDNGITISHQTADSLIQVVQKAQKIADTVGNIDDSAQKQTVAIEVITRRVDEISSVIQTNSATAEESAAASEELNGQANMLKTLVSKFSLLKNDNFKQIDSAMHIDSELDTDNQSKY